MNRQALGKGLDALLPQVTPQPGNALVELGLDQITPNAFQPRLAFNSQALDELAESIREKGLLQPIVVRRKGSAYEIVAGERRWRAARKAGLQQIPALVQDVSEQQMLEVALVENIQRDDLSPIEEAHAYDLLVEQFGLTQEEVAQRVGRSRSAVTNTLRLLKLPRPLQKAVAEGHLSMGHARALLPLSEKEQLALWQLIVRRGLSVRETERRVKQLQNPSRRRKPVKDIHLRDAERKLEEQWKTQVQIRPRGQGGQIVLYFHSSQELDQLYQRLLGNPLSLPKT